ncbi:hypothetical protein [Streptomyces luteocolor]|uniref:hypothetical protein n=1 Tax=Streptomyces luteocolor TaxID=285500 RepID=UPI000A8B48F5|nr:hypothetical protein [Streptomyces luteocolor]
MTVETPAGHARNAALALVTALLDGDNEAAWDIARSEDHDGPTLVMILARVVAKSTTPQQWRQTAIDIANGTRWPPPGRWFRPPPRTNRQEHPVENHRTVGVTTEWTAELLRDRLAADPRTITVHADGKPFARLHLAFALDATAADQAALIEKIRDVAARPEPDPGAVARPFHLQRDHDVSGVSGTGIVAHGVLWPDGTASVRWAGPRPSIVFWDSIDDALAVHGHGGHTRLVFADEAAS